LGILLKSRVEVGNIAHVPSFLLLIGTQDHYFPFLFVKEFTPVQILHVTC